MPSPSPPFTCQIPPGPPCRVQIIDSTSRIQHLPAKVLISPPVPGFENMPDLPTWSFLISHSSGRKLLFDLGVPVDWEDTAPTVRDRLKSNGWGISVQKSTVDILSEQGVDPKDIEVIVWSHWHWDHIGNPGHFPRSTKLIVGPGFKDEILPAYPENPKSNVREIDFDGRELLEITFTEKEACQIGPFRALDYFGDGSFYLLDTPGHAVGHLAGLARTTSSSAGAGDRTNSKDTFIFMGGDLTHHPSELRPSPYLPLPATLPTALVPLLSEYLSAKVSCPCSEIFTSLQESRGRNPPETTPFVDPAMGKDIPLAIETIKKTQLADADDGIFYAFAHDATMRGVVDFFPAGANEWQELGWREKVLWKFLDDFVESVKQAGQGRDGAKEGDASRL